MEIGHEVAGTRRDTGAAGLDRLVKGGRVGQQDQGGAHRIHELAQVKVDALPLGLVHVGRVALLQQPVRGEQIDLLESAVDGVRVPLGCGEPLVSCGDSRPFRRSQVRNAQPALTGFLPDIERRAPHVLVQVDRGSGGLGLSQ